MALTSDRGTILTFYWHNLPRETEWRVLLTNVQCMMYGAVIAKINSPYGKIYRRTAKVAITFKQSEGGIIHTFQLHNLPRETE